MKIEFQRNLVPWTLFSLRDSRKLAPLNISVGADRSFKMETSIESWRTASVVPSKHRKFPRTTTSPWTWRRNIEFTRGGRRELGWISFERRRRRGGFVLERARPALSPFARPTSLSLSLFLGKMKQRRERIGWWDKEEGRGKGVWREREWERERKGSESAPRIKAWKGAAARSSGTRRRDSFQKRRINSRLFASNHRVDDLDRWSQWRMDFYFASNDLDKYNYNRRNKMCIYMYVYRVSR